MTLRSRRGVSTLETIIVSACMALSFFTLGQLLFRVWCEAVAFAWLVFGAGLP